MNPWPILAAVVIFAAGLYAGWQYRDGQAAKEAMEAVEHRDKAEEELREDQDKIVGHFAQSLRDRETRIGVLHRENAKLRQPVPDVCRPAVADFVRDHDDIVSAATGRPELDAASAGIGLDRATATIGLNYQRCENTADQLRALQAVVKSYQDKQKDK